jgi:hypothetical protein
VAGTFDEVSNSLVVIDRPARGVVPGDQGPPTSAPPPPDPGPAGPREVDPPLERAATESRAQLKQQIDQARVDVELARKDGKEQVGEAADRAQSKWTQLKSDVSAKMDELKTRADKRADQLDAKAADNDADWAEMEAADAIDYASWAADNARLAVLAVLDAPAYATELAQSLHS